MKKISAFLLSSFLIMSISVGAMAQAPLITSVTLSSGTVEVEGTCAGDKPLTIEVLQEGKEWTDIATAEESAETDISALLGVLYYFNQTDTFGENGSFKFTIIDWAGAEEPEMRVYSGGEYFYHSPETIKEINAATNVTDFKSKVTGHLFLAGEMGKIEKDILNDNEDEKNEFWTKLFNYKEKIKADNTIGFKNFGEIVECAPEIALLSKVKLAANADMTKMENRAYMAKTLELLESYVIKDSNSWDIYMNSDEFKDEDYLTDEQEIELCALLREKATVVGEAECFRAQEFVNYFNEAVVLTACQKRGSAYLVRNIIEKSDVLAKENTGDFSKLTAENKLSVAEIIDDAQSVCATITALAKKISDNAKTYAPDDDRYTPPTGGGGGGGGGKTYAVEKVPEKEETQSKGEFTDLESHKWAEEAIYALQEKGIVQGTGENSFEPARAVTREEFVKMLVLSADIFDENATVPFKDTAQGAWYVPYVGSAYNAKLINGITEDMFGIGRVITREQLAVMIYRALDSQHALQSVNAEDAFSDIDKVSDFALDAVNYVKASGLMNGMGDGSFAPHENVNRAQAAKVIYELLQRL